MPTLKVTEEQLRLIQSALDMYSRIGMGQFKVIKDHPTFENVLRESIRPKKELEIGDRTESGEIIEITGDKVKTLGYWNSKKEIREYSKDKIKLSVDYEKYHNVREIADSYLNMARNTLIQEDMKGNASYGIYNDNVDDSCRVAFDIIQVIRHEFWKKNPNRNSITVDSSCHLTEPDSDKIKCSLD